MVTHETDDPDAASGRGRARDLWHVGLVVHDIDDAIAFYTESLGLKLRHRQTQENTYTSELVG